MKGSVFDALGVIFGKLEGILKGRLCVVIVVVVESRS